MAGRDFHAAAAGAGGTAAGGIDTERLRAPRSRERAPLRRDERLKMSTEGSRRLPLGLSRRDALMIRAASRFTGKSCALGTAKIRFRLKKRSRKMWGSSSDSQWLASSERPKWPNRDEYSCPQIEYWSTRLEGLPVRS